MEGQDTPNEFAAKLADLYRRKIGEAGTVELGGYSNLGAVIADTALQAGTNYERVVWPRIKAYLAEYGELTTLTDFVALADSVGLGTVFNWKGQRKVKVMQDLIAFCAANDVNTVDDLAQLLRRTDVRGQLMEIKGVKEKSANYIAMLVGVEAIAVDRHLRTFADLAELPPSLDFASLATAYEIAAGILGITPRTMDHSVWTWATEHGSSQLDSPNHP